MLQTIIDVSKHKPSVYFVVLLSLVVQTAVSIFYSFAAIAVYVTWTPGNPCEWEREGLSWDDRDGGGLMILDVGQLVRPTRVPAERSLGWSFT